MRNRTTNRNGTIDVIRILACFAVIFCHVELPGIAKDWSMALARFAVPYFLMVTGWYLWRTDAESESKEVKRFLHSLLKMFVFSAIVIGIINCIVFSMRGQPPFTWLTDYWKQDHALFGLLMYNRLSYFSSIMYYFPMIIYVGVIWLILLKTGTRCYAYWAILPLLAANLIRGEFLGLKWYYQGNWLFTGIPFVFLGSLMNEKGVLRKIPVLAAWMLIGMGQCQQC